VDIYLEAAAGKNLKIEIHNRDSRSRRLRFGTPRTGGTHRSAASISARDPALSSHNRSQGRRRDSIRRLSASGSCKLLDTHSRAFAF
jgi:hypothetical protein